MSVFQLSKRITLFPVIHGSADVALTVRRMMLENKFDCLAVPLPPSFQENVEQAIEWLPALSVVAEETSPQSSFGSEWQPDSDFDTEFDDDWDEEAIEETQWATTSYVPIDPCQPEIAALRIAEGERMRREFVDLEVDDFQSYSGKVPDAYALKHVDPERFAAAVLPTIPPLPHEQARRRVQHMAARLCQLERESENESRSERILMLCGVHDWPWIRGYYQRFMEGADDPEAHVAASSDETDSSGTVTYRPDPQTALFMLGELPFITGLYERARSELENDDNLAIDGVKELLITAREEYRKDFKNRSRRITPFTLSTILKYVRNLTLMDRRLTPGLYTLVIASKQVAGDSFALHVAEQSREYAFERETPFESATLGIDRWRLPNGDMVHTVNRLPGPPVTWRTCELRPRPSRQDRQKWEMQWNPYGQCSWPPEDEKIEDFRTHVADKAMQLMGMDLAKTQKFTSSIEDGIDIRETLRNWHTGDLYVKVNPPTSGRLDCVVMLFDSPADPREYPWRSTWFAEHQNESTLAFFASDFQKEMLGPGVAMGVYGGALFLFPPVAIPDIWTDPRLDFVTTLEERILAAACLHSECPQIALLSALPPGAGWRKLAKRFGKKWVHVPLGGFSQSTIHQLRIVHVLNGHHVRSYAADFIRKA